MKIYFIDRNQDIINALMDEYQSSPTTGMPWAFDAQMHVGDILENNVDSFVSPANSIGNMDGGIDRYYSETFGWDLSERLKEKINNRNFYGELLVGEALVVETNNENFPFMISAPTMRTPRILGDAGSENVFLATRAAMTAAYEYGFNSIAIPGMGTGVGGVPVKGAAFSMLCGCQAATLKFNNT